MSLQSSVSVFLAVRRCVVQRRHGQANRDCLLYSEYDTFSSNHPALIVLHLLIRLGLEVYYCVDRRISHFPVMSESMFREDMDSLLWRTEQSSTAGTPGMKAHLANNDHRPLFFATPPHSVTKGHVPLRTSSKS